MRIGLGVITYNRPDYFRQAAEGIAKHLSGVVDSLVVVNDGSEAQHLAAYDDAEALLLPLGADCRWHSTNGGVGKAKNNALRALLAAECDWLFLSEDDIVVQSGEAIRGYIAACERSGWQHLCFHAHGPANPTSRGCHYSGAVTYWPNSVGAWCVYTREALVKGGLLDEGFHNAWEHVEHTQRLACQGFTSVWPDNADATGSERWLKEIPDAIDNSSIRPRADWQESIDKGRDHWREAHPNTYQLIFGR